MSIFDRLQNIDRRILYLLLFLAVVLPLLFSAPVPPAAVSPQARGFFDTLERVPPEKMVILSASFSSSTAAENLTQIETVMRHLMKRKLKFAIFGFIDPQGRELAQKVADRLQSKYGYVYGRDYVNWGFRRADQTVLLTAMVRDLPGTLGRDIHGTPLASVPVMAGIKGVNDIGAVIELTGSDSLPLWLGYFRSAGEKPIPTLFCPTAVMAPEAFPYLKSGQLQGMLVGLKGAIEYEGLIGERGFATTASAALSYSHFLIIGLIILGNVGMLATRARRTGAVTPGGGSR